MDGAGAVSVFLPFLPVENEDTKELWQTNLLQHDDQPVCINGDELFVYEFPSFCSALIPL